MKNITAYAWASGLIEYTTRAQRVVPEGAIAIATGPTRQVREAIESLAREGMGESAGKFLVPGVPEAKLMKTDPVDALTDFCRRIQSCVKRLTPRKP